jgi:hypothetical protein
MDVRVITLLLCSLLAAHTHALCDLTGRWTGYVASGPLYDNYYITQNGNQLLVSLSPTFPK